MRIFRRLFSVLMVLALLMSCSVTVFAAEYQAGNAEELSTAFSGVNNEAGDTTVNVTLTGDIVSNNILNTQEGWSYTIGNAADTSYTLTEAQFSGSGTVEINADLNSGDNSPDALSTYDNVSVTVNGDLTAADDGVSAYGESNVTVNGNVDAGYGIYANEDSTVTVNGDITAVYDGILATGNSTAIANGNIVSDNFGVEVSDESTVTVNGNITSEYVGVFASTSSNVTVEGNIISNYDTGVNANGESTVAVNGNINATNNAVYADSNSNVTIEGDITTNGGDGVVVYGESTVAVNGNIDAACDGVEIGGNSNVTVEGDITANEYGIYAYENSTISVNGDIEGGNSGIYASGDSTVTVDGDVSGKDGNPEDVDYSDPFNFSDGGDGILAGGNVAVTVSGNVSGGEGYGTWGYAGDGIGAFDNATVTVGGNVSGGSVTADPNTVGCISNAGHAIVAYSSTSKVSVGGNAIGGNTNGDSGEAGSGIITIVDAEENCTGSITIGGSVSGGKAENGTNGNGIHLWPTSADTGALATPTITVGSVSNITVEGGILSDEQTEALIQSIKVTSFTNADIFWMNVAKSLRKAEAGEEITIDVGSRTTIPEYIVKAALEKGVTLIIQWDGGEDIVIDETFDAEAVGGIYQLSDLVK